MGSVRRRRAQTLGSGTRGALDVRGGADPDPVRHAHLCPLSHTPPAQARSCPRTASSSPARRAGTTPAGPSTCSIDQQPAAVVLPADERDVVAHRPLRPRARPARGAAGDRPQRRAARLARRTSSLNTSGLDRRRRSTPTRGASASAPATRWERRRPALSELGLAALHGSSPDVGIAGYSLGGGMGWLARKHGLQTNSVTAFELVTADGHLVRTDAEHEPELFWALRGGGGNFGVVTAIEFEVYPWRSSTPARCSSRSSGRAEVLHAWTELLPAPPRGADDLGEHPALPARLRRCPSALRGHSFTIVWRPSSARGGGPRAAGADARPRPRRWTRSRWCRRPSSATWRWTRATRCRSSAATSCSASCPPPASTTSSQSSAPARRARDVQLRHLGGALGRHRRARARGRRCPARSPVRPRRRARARRRVPRSAASSRRSRRGRALPRRRLPELRRGARRTPAPSSTPEPGSACARSRRCTTRGRLQGQPPDPPVSRAGLTLPRSPPRCARSPPSSRSPRPSPDGRPRPARSVKYVGRAPPATRYLHAEERPHP